MRGVTDTRARPARRSVAEPVPAPRSRARTVMIVLMTIVAMPFLLIAFLASFDRSR
ncbi:hypothetical protein [Sphingomonas hylomeconis]|uniref:Uncharacterized protein n=1 Tax=Sphingomonas hylomeconis TaxID=1395958 RepID=A0ABV7SZR2_9SPHN|nr:hypothetical protein [Sphingomonas hylomeconis]